MWEKADLLKNVAYPAAKNMIGNASRVHSIDAYRSGCRLDQSVDHLQRSCLAGTRTSDEDEQVSRGNGEGYVAYDEILAKTLGQATDLYQQLFSVPIRSNATFVARKRLLDIVNYIGRRF